MVRNESKPLTPDQREQLLRWKHVGPLLDAIRHEELRRMTEEEYLDAMNQLLSLPADREAPAWSGLVEWQRALRKLKIKIESENVTNRLAAKTTKSARKKRKRISHVGSHPDWRH